MICLIILDLLNQELFDLALIEVVKGPQGALYGKNAIGGAINILRKLKAQFIEVFILHGFITFDVYLSDVIVSLRVKKGKDKSSIVGGQSSRYIKMIKNLY